MTQREYCWEIEEGRVDSTQFIEMLSCTFPNASTLYFEGSSISSDVKLVFDKFIQEGPYLPDGQVIWPKSVSKFYRCDFSDEFLNHISSLTHNHAEPELFDHMFIYRNEHCLMRWHDAFSNYIWISKVIPENKVKNLAGKFNLKYNKVYES